MLARVLGWVLPHLGMVGRFRGDEPRFWYFKSEWVPIFTPQPIRLEGIVIAWAGGRVASGTLCMQ